MAIVLPNLRGQRPAADHESLELLFKCGGGIELRAPAETVFPRFGRKADDDRDQNLQDLLRDLVAFRQAKRK